MTTRETVALGDPAKSFGAFQPTHTNSQVAEALRRCLPADELRRLADLVGKAADRRRREHKAPDQLAELARLLSQAAAGDLGPVQGPTGPAAGDQLA